MPASRNLTLPARLGLPLAGALLLAACGSNSGIGGTSGSSSGGGSNAVLAGTYFKANTSTRKNDSAHIFGAVNSVGNGYFADLAGSSRAIFVFDSASSSGTINGNFAAYAANGSNLGDGTSLENGSISGTVAIQSGTTSASVIYAGTASGTLSTTATLVLDQPALSAIPLATAAGTYSVALGTTAIASTALFNLAGGSYNLNLTASGGASLTTVSGCALSGSASLDGTYNIYDLHLSGSCSGSTVVLDGQATYLPAGAASPLDGSSLSAATLLVELSDFLSNVSSPQYALVLIAPKSS